MMVRDKSHQDSRDSNSPFGVLDFLPWDNEKFAFHYRPQDVDRSIALMQEAGVGFVRFDFLWADIEPVQGHYIFRKYDRLVDRLLQHGIKIQGILAYNPLWSGGEWNQAPDPVRYCQYARAVAEHFRDRVRHWQIWHEPDNPAFWQPQDAMRAYTDLLRQVYPLLKVTDATCQVHLAGMSRSLPMSIKNVYEKGGKPFFDVVDIHPFANPLMPDALGGIRYLYETVRRVLEANGDTAKPVWFTEIGCPGMRDPKSAPNWWLGNNPSEVVQADWVAKVYGELLSLEGVEKIFWCFFRDTERHFNSGSDYDGLIRHDFSKKPSFEVYRDVVSRHPLNCAE